MAIDNILIIGCGDIGRRVAALAREEGATVTALVRSAEKGELLHTLGIATIPGDLDDLETLGALPTRRATVFYFAPPPAAA